VRAADDTIVNAELWDFPGTIAGHRHGALLSTFFDAAIICYSTEDVNNMNSIFRTVSHTRHKQKNM
jgi:hypothetical protein